MAIGSRFGAFAKFCDSLASSPFATALAVGVVGLWACLGPVFHYSDTWQLVMNTTSSIITFIMVFIIQSTQNRDGRALQTKLDAILVAIEGDHDHLMGLEDLPEKVIKKVQVEVHGGTDDVELQGGVGRGYAGPDHAEVEVVAGAAKRA